MLSTLPIHNVETLATVVMNLMQGCLYIRWYDKDRNLTHTILGYQRIWFDVDPTNYTVNLPFGAS